ncbi:MAG: hypothetical protein AABZ60_08485 [Planctomycetota bacterium]
MKTLDIKKELINEVNLIPEEKLVEIYHLIHYFRIGLESQETKKQPPKTLQFFGVWNDLDKETIKELTEDLLKRRELVSRRRE